MRLTPCLLSLILVMSTISYGDTSVHEYNTDEMKALDINTEHGMVLHTGISLLLPYNASSFYRSSNYVFNSADKNTTVNIRFYGVSDKRGEALHNCDTTF